MAQPISDFVISNVPAVGLTPSSQCWVICKICADLKQSCMHWTGTLRFMSLISLLCSPHAPHWRAVCEQLYRWPLSLLTGYKQSSMFAEARSVVAWDELWEDEMCAWKTNRGIGNQIIHHQVEGFAQDGSNSIALELLLSCAKPSM